MYGYCITDQNILGKDVAEKQKGSKVRGAMFAKYTENNIRDLSPKWVYQAMTH